MLRKKKKNLSNHSYLATAVNRLPWRLNWKKTTRRGAQHALWYNMALMPYLSLKRHFWLEKAGQVAALKLWIDTCKKFWHKDPVLSLQQCRTWYIAIRSIWPKTEAMDFTLIYQSGVWNCVVLSEKRGWIQFQVWPLICFASVQTWRMRM